MDPISRRSFWRLLYDLAEGGTTIMVTTHYMDEAEHCQNLAFIQGGRIVAQGSPAVIKDTNMRGQVLEIDCDQPAVAIPALRRMGVFDEVALYGALIHAIMPDQSPEGDLRQRLELQIETALHEAGVSVRTMDPIAPSLEDVFISSVRAPHAQNDRQGQ